MKYCPLCNKEFPEGDVCDVDGATLVRAPMDAELQPGQVLKGSYRIEERLAAGGMGVVYRATQITLERPVAVKTLLPHLVSTASMVQRFFQEAKLASQLNHPNVVSIIDFGNTEDGHFFMVMEYLEGQSLKDLVPISEGLPVDRALELIEQVCAGVGAAHRRGLVHRDLKPDNIFVTGGRGEVERVKVLDFGIARTVEDGANTRLTQSGMLMGTPAFIAPEQIEESAAADARSDIYALGAVLCFLLTGCKPYEGDTPPSILAKQLFDGPEIDASLSEKHPRLSEVVLKAMQRDPDDRYQSTDEMLAALAEAADNADPGASSAVSLAESVAKGGQSGVSTTASPRGSADRVVLNRFKLLGAVAAALTLLPMGVWGWRASQSDMAVDQRGRSSGSGRGGEDASGEIRVGMSAAFSGPSRELGRGMQVGIETHFREINEAGGLAGRELRLIALDDAYSPGRTVANMTDLLEQHDVFAILGNVGTPTAEVALPLVMQQDVPFIAPFTGAALLRLDPPTPQVFHFRASYAEETRAIIRHFVETRGVAPDRIGVFAQDDSFGDEGYSGVVEALRSRGHSGEVPRLGYRRNTIDVRAAVQGVLQQFPDLEAIVIVATYRSAAAFIRDLEDAGRDLVFANLSFVGSRALAEELRELGPGYADGVVVTQVVPHYESTLVGVERYRAQLRRYFPAESPGFVSLEGYLAARLFVEMLRHSLEAGGGRLDREIFLESFAEVGEVDLGIGERLSFSSDDHQGSSRVWGTHLDSDASYRDLGL